jgi:Lon protease-like protein
VSSTENFPLFPLHAVLFPEGLLALRVFEQRYLDMVSRVARDESTFGVCLIAAGTEVGEAAVPHLIGTEAKILRWGIPAPGVFSIVVRGERRFRIVDHELECDGLLMGEVNWLPEPVVQPVPQAQAELIPLLYEIVQREADRVAEPYRFDDAGWVGARYAELLPIPLLARQRLLELDDVISRLEIVQEYLRQHGLMERRPVPPISPRT